MPKSHLEKEGFEGQKLMSFECKDLLIKQVEGDKLVVAEVRQDDVSIQILGISETECKVLQQQQILQQKNEQSDEKFFSLVPIKSHCIGLYEYQAEKKELS